MKSCLKRAYTKNDAALLRKLCLDNAQRISERGDVVVMLSGGIDSVTVLYAFLAAGKMPLCVNFSFDGYASDDSASAEMQCARCGCELKRVVVPAPSWDDVRRSASACVGYFGTVRKVKCESWYAMDYTAAYLPDDCVVVSGGNGDELFGYHRSQAIQAARLGDSHPDVVRRRYGDRARDEFLCLASGGREYVDFFYDEAICDFVTQFPASVCNRRFPKSLMYYAFEEEHKANCSYRRPKSFVKAGGEDAMFEDAAARFGFDSALRMFNAAYREVRDARR